MFLRLSIWTFDRIFPGILSYQPLTMRWIRNKHSLCWLLRHLDCSSTYRASPWQIPEASAIEQVRDGNARELDMSSGGCESGCSLNLFSKWRLPGFLTHLKRGVRKRGGVTPRILSWTARRMELSGTDRKDHGRKRRRVRRLWEGGDQESSSGPVTFDGCHTWEQRWGGGVCGYMQQNAGPAGASCQSQL